MEARFAARPLQGLLRYAVKQTRSTPCVERGQESEDGMGMPLSACREDEAVIPMSRRRF